MKRKTVCGLLFLIMALGLFVWVGGYLCFYCGMADTVRGLPTSSMNAGVAELSKLRIDLWITNLTLDSLASSINHVLTGWGTFRFALWLGFGILAALPFAAAGYFLLWPPAFAKNRPRIS